MPSRRTLRSILLLMASVLLLPSAAFAQEGSTWEDAPSEPKAAPSDAMVPYDDRDPAALNDFNQELAPYGAWREDATYGRVWIPRGDVVGPNFAPYVTSGHWAVASDGGWLWVSDYSWGWVVFHYGRWVWISDVGWAWIPGRQYAHAWVVWRVADPGWDYVGWAPMPPDYVWFNGVAVGVWFGLYTPWVFCPSGYVYHHHMHSYIVHDHYYSHQIATHSHRYGPPRGAPPWSGPTPQRAHIPAKAVPKQHTPAHPKAVASSRQKASERDAKIISGNRARPGARRVDPGARLPSRTLPGSSNEPLRSARPPETGPGPYPPRAYQPGPGAGRSRPGPGAPSYSYGGRRSAPSRAAPSSPSRSPGPSAPPTRTAPSNSYRSGPPATAPAPSVAPRRPAAPSRPSGGRRR